VQHWGAADSTGVFIFSLLSKNFGSSAENRALQYPDQDDVAPRFGFAWQPFHAGQFF
jgi:hypothetical protein